MRRVFGKGIILFTGGILGYFLKYPENWNFLNANAASNKNSEFKFPIPNYEYPNQIGIKKYNNFIVSYNRRTRVADWVMECITQDTLGLPGANPDYRENIKFREDDTESELFRSTLLDYHRSGYDRGHMAPAGNYKNHKSDCDKSFILTNISPQVGMYFNRGIWARVEHFGRELVQDSEYVLICSGPLFLPKKIDNFLSVHYDVIGPNNVAVPTHFFKVILAKEKDSTTFKLFSYVLPNIAIKSDDFSLFYVPLKDIERSAGFLIFSQITDSLKFSQINNEYFS